MSIFPTRILLATAFRGGACRYPAADLAKPPVEFPWSMLGTCRDLLAPNEVDRPNRA